MSVEDVIRSRLVRASARHAELLRQSQAPEVASDHVRVGRIMREMGGLTHLSDLFDELVEVESDLSEARKLLETEEDEETQALAEMEVIEKQERLREILDEAVDHVLEADGFGGRNVILEIRAGTGGGEAALFAGDLLRMYTRFAERQNYRLEALSAITTELGGVREVVLCIKGRDAYQKLRYESGGHRVQRVPETEAQGRIHTSMATVAVMPEAEEVDVDVRRDDLKIDFYRASGPGGQKVNKTSSAVRIVHIPTGIKVECQDEKSQHKNKSRAMKILLARIMNHHRSIADEERSDMRRTQIGSGDRNERIRTYNFPQNRVTDHRVNLTLYDLGGVMDGDLEPLFTRFAEYHREQRLKALEDEGV